MVRFRDGIAPSEIDVLVRRLGASVIRDYPHSAGLKLLRLPDDLSVARARYLFSRSPVVDVAEPNFIYHLSVEPNDPSFALQWGLNNTGQTLGVPDVDINAPEAWDVTTGNAGVVIGILDGGVDYQHVDL
ncbi:MAG: S8 family serine peptidase, partial [Planctomycetota bacterium]